MKKYLLYVLAPVLFIGVVFLGNVYAANDGHKNNEDRPQREHPIKDNSQEEARQLENKINQEMNRVDRFIDRLEDRQEHINNNTNPIMPSQSSQEVDYSSAIEELESLKQEMLQATSVEDLRSKGVELKDILSETR